VLALTGNNSVEVLAGVTESLGGEFAAVGGEELVKLTPVLGLEDPGWDRGYL
jgi:hypothetical protein